MSEGGIGEGGGKEKGGREGVRERRGGKEGRENIHLSTCNTISYWLATESYTTGRTLLYH